MKNKAANTSILNNEKITFGNVGRFSFIMLLLSCLLVLALILNVNIGSVSIAMQDVFGMIWDGIRYGIANIFTRGSFVEEWNRVMNSSTESQILFRIRIPRMLLAAILGGALSVSGYLLQVFFRNPIAGPFVLGISSGAKMVVGITLIFLTHYIGIERRNIQVHTPFAVKTLPDGRHQHGVRKIGIILP